MKKNKFHKTSSRGFIDMVVRTESDHMPYKYQSSTISI